MNSTLSAESPETRRLSRRELLYYFYGATAALLASGTCGAVAWYTRNPLLIRDTSGIFTVSLRDIPPADWKPEYIGEWKCYLAHTSPGLLALDPRCTINHWKEFKTFWMPDIGNFMCPWCPSRYRLDGTVVYGPATRGLTRFLVEVTTTDGTLRSTPPTGEAVSIEDAQIITVDTLRRIPGQQRI